MPTSWNSWKFRVNKGFAGIYILVGILLLVVLGGAYYFSKSQTPKPQTTPALSSTPDETVYTEASRSANWKTYTNEKYKFEFRYPTNWKVHEDVQSSFVQLQEIKDGKTVSIAGGITIVDKTIPNYPTYVKMFASKTRCPEEAGSIDLSDTVKVYCLTGKEIQTSADTWRGAVECSASYLYGEKGDPETCPHQFWIQTKDFFYIIHLNFFEPIIKGSKEEIFFDQILSTFKFLDQDTTSGT